MSNKLWKMQRPITMSNTQWWFYIAQQILIKVAHFYLFSLAVWFVLWILIGDRWWWSFLINSFVPFYFMPLIVVIPIAIVMRDMTTRVGTLGAVVLALLLYGELFLPTMPPAVVQQSSTPITILTSNLLYSNKNIDGIITSLRASNADVIALQELTYPVAVAIKEHLLDEYPYQYLVISTGSNGNGIISRYPIHPAGEVTLPDAAWINRGRVVVWLDIQGTRALFANIHATPPTLSSVAQLQQSITMREQQAESLVQLAQAWRVPLIVAGDFNSTDMSTTYRIITKELRDSWREVGVGLGHSFPNSGIPLKFGSFSPTSWMVRIDYVFHNDHFTALSADIGPWDGGADHRPVLVTLQLHTVPVAKPTVSYQAAQHPASNVSFER